MLYIKPDYVTWASLESLSPHAIACLFLDVHPTPDPAISLPLGAPPAIPEDFADDFDQNEWDASYHRIYCPLRSGLLASVFKCPVAHQISPVDAIEYLNRVAYENNWDDGFFESEFFKTVRAKRSSRTQLLEAEVESLKAKLEAASSRCAYSTPQLQWLFRAIEEHYDNYPKRTPKKETVVNWIVEQSEAEGCPVTKTSATRIAVVLTPPDRKLGGLLPRKLP